MPLNIVDDPYASQLPQDNSALQSFNMPGDRTEYVSDAQTQQQPQQPQSKTLQGFDDSATITAPKRQPLTAMQVLASIVGGPAAGSAIRSQSMQQQSAEVNYQARTKLSKALAEGDIAKADKLVSQLGQYADMSPAIGELLKSATSQIDKVRERARENTIVADTYLSIPGIPKDSSLYHVLQAGKANPTLFDKAGFIELIKTNIIKSNFSEGVQQQVDAATGRVLGQQVVPRGTTTKDWTPAENEAFDLNVAGPLNYSKAKFLEHQSIWDTQKDLAGMSPKDVEKFLQARQIMYGSSTQQGAVAGAIGRKNFPPAEAVKMQLEPGQAQQLATGQQTQSQTQAPQGPLTPAQQQTSALAHQFTQVFKGNPTLIQGILRTESSFGANQQGKTGDSGPMQITNNRVGNQPGTADVITPKFNKANGTNFTTEQVMNDPKINTAVGVWYATQLERQYGGDTARAAYAYNKGEQAANTASTETINNSSYVKQVLAGQDKVTRQAIPQVDYSQHEGETITQQHVRIEGQKKEQQDFLIKQGQLQAEREGKPASEQFFYFKKNANGDLQGYNGPTLSHSDMKEKGWAYLPFPVGTKIMTAYTGLKADAEGLAKELDSLSTDTKERLAQGLVRATGKGINLPFIGRFATSGLATADDVKLMTRLSAFSQQVEHAINPDGKENADVGFVKDNLTGVLSGRISAKAALETVVQVIDDRMTKYMQSINPNSVTEKPQLTEGQKSILASQQNRDNPTGRKNTNTPTYVRDPVTKEYTRVEEGFLAKPSYENLLGDVVNLPARGIQALKMLDNAVGQAQETTQWAIKDYLSNFNPNNMDKNEQRAAIKALERLKLDQETKEGAIKLKGLLYRLIDPNYKSGSNTKYLSTYEAVTPSWARKPINSNTLRSINDQITQ